MKAGLDLKVTENAICESRTLDGLAFTALYYLKVNTLHVYVWFRWTYIHNEQ